MSESMSLPDHFEVVVLGTGLVESTVAAAAARLGHTVLHVDTAGYYGGEYASFTLEGLSQWISGDSTGKRNQPSLNDESCDETTPAPAMGEDESLMGLADFKTVVNICEKWYVPDKIPTETSDQTKTEENAPHDHEKSDDTDTKKTASDENVESEGEDPIEGRKTASRLTDGSTSSVETCRKSDEQKWSKEMLLKESRRFNIDLAPRLLYARGSMVELLISSNISRYTEFKSITRVLTQIDGRIEHVPSSRADVFGTKHISVVEKRILMKFLSHCVNHKVEEILGETEDKSFREFLKQENLTENLIHFVIHSIAMVRPDADARHGIAQTTKFLSSLGRFGSTPFLWSMYGSGELPQAFCRLCAVFGGVYYLGRNLTNLIVKDGKCVGIITEGKRIGCDYLVLPDKSTPDSLLPDGLTQVGTQRCVYVTQSSLLPTEKEQLTLLSLPAKEPLHVLEVGPGTAACPKGLQVVHASMKRDGGSLDELDSRVRQVLPADSILYSASFTQLARTGDVTTRLANVYRACGPLPELDFDAAVEQGRDIYQSIFPQEEFLPRAPDPEEIIIGDEGEETSGTGEENSEREHHSSDHPTVTQSEEIDTTQNRNTAQNQQVSKEEKSTENKSE